MKFKIPINISVKCVACGEKLDAVIVDEEFFDIVIGVDNEHKCPAAQQSAQSDLAVRPAGCKCASFVFDGTHHKDCPIK